MKIDIKIMLLELNFPGGNELLEISMQMTY